MTATARRCEVWPSASGRLRYLLAARTRIGRVMTRTLASRYAFDYTHLGVQKRCMYAVLSVALLYQKLGRYVYPYQVPDSSFSLLSGEPCAHVGRFCANK